ncbi:MAG TPA: DUF192 domain-containing protein [Candidatus Baltobacteraceae bacterium]|nr:DUF192 domain-containing protein [Candidatus Baltobacteraceae bacterium]
MRHKRFALAFVAVACAASFVPCAAGRASAQTPPPVIVPAPPPLPTPLAWCDAIPLPKAGCRSADVRAPLGTMRLAVAANEARRERGLMNVATIPRGQGMLFVFPGTDQDLHFWMKDTIAPLDMVFVKADGTISAIAANVPATKPGTPDDAVARRAGTGRYVIELGAGDAARLGLARGRRLALPAIVVTD